MAPRESSSRPSGGGHRHRERRSDRPRSGGQTTSKRNHNKKRRSRRPAPGTEEAQETPRSGQSLSAGALNDLNREYERRKRKSERAERMSRRGVSRDEYRPVRREEEEETPRKQQHRKSKKRRVVSGAIMEEGRAKSGLRGGGSWSGESFEKQDYYQKRKPKKKSKKKLWILLGVSLVLLIIIIAVAVVVSKNKHSSSSNGGSSSSDSSGTDSKSNLKGKNRDEVPEKWRNTYLDPWSWQSTVDFNVTFTAETVGDLPVMGLNKTWDDSAKANDQVPALNEDWGSYGKRPARGVALGGWLMLEPFITPSLFDYSSEDNVVDEWTLMQKLGASASSTLEQHYATFVTEQTFKDIQDAGLDHVRIPFSYWAVEVYDGDPYLFRTSWRYLLRGIEWARKYGLRVNLGIHGIQGSQNGMDHSGHSGTVGWLNGTDGTTNAQRALEMHGRLAKFFAQKRYKNIVSFYSIANEPLMTSLDVDSVLSWTTSVYDLVTKNGLKANIVFGDGFMGISNWQGKLTGTYADMVLDMHQYVIFNVNQIDFTHQEKVNYACKTWTEQAEQAMDPERGHGPTIFAEWSQADTDCAKWLTGVNRGTRWEGTLNTGNASTSVLKPDCTTKNSQCQCDKANASPDDWSDEYKKFLLMFAEAQMHSFEKGWGWWYWTWKTEGAYQWDYQAGRKAGVLPQKAWQRDFNCDSTVPDYSKSGLPETY